MELFRVFGRLALEGAEATQSGLREANKAAGDLAESLGKTGRSVQSAGDQLSKWVSGPIAAVGAGAIGLASQLGNTADAILDTADATGMSTQAIQEWQAVAQIAGTSTNAMADATMRLNQMIGSIADGSGPAAAAIERLGINTSDFVGMRPDERMDALVAALQGIEDPAERAELGMQLFSRRWEQLAPIVGLGAEAMDRAREAGRRLAMNEDQLNAANNFRMRMVELRQEFGLVWREISLALLPVAEQFLDYLNSSLVPAVQTAAATLTRVVEAFQSLPEPVQLGIAGLIALVAAVGPVLSIFGRLMQAALLVRGAVMGLAAAKGVLLLALSPIGLAVAAVVGAVALAVAAWTRYGDTIREWVRSATERLRDWGAAIGQRFAEAVEAARARIAEMAEVVVTGLVSLRDRGLEVVSGFVGRVRDFFRELPSAIAGYIQSMASEVVDRVNRMVDAVIDRLNALRRRVVGNSIIPDMVNDVVRHMGRMADDSISETERMRSGVEGEVPGPGDITVRRFDPVEMARQARAAELASMSTIERLMGRALGGSGGGAGGRSGFADMRPALPAPGGGSLAFGSGPRQEPARPTMQVDMRHMIVRDERDLFARLRRHGVEVGA